MIQEPKLVLRDALFFDDDSEEIMNDSLGTVSLSDSTGTDSERKTQEEEEIERRGYATDERQD